MDKRDFKDKVYFTLARVAKAMANPHRLEIIDLLAQSDRTVEEIAAETNLPLANASQHLQVLKNTNLVEVKREGNFIRYRLANENIFRSWQIIREIGFERFTEIEKLVKDFREKKNVLEAVSIDELVTKMKSSNVVLIDVRPEQEFRAGHIPNAISIPIDKLVRKIKSFSKSKQYIAYCRGPLCVFADDAVSFLKKKGFKAMRLNEGFPDWKLRGLDTRVNF